MIIAGPNGQSLNPTAPKLGGAARGWSEPHTRAVYAPFWKINLEEEEEEEYTTSICSDLVIGFDFLPSIMR